MSILDGMKDPHQLVDVAMVMEDEVRSELQGRHREMFMSGITCHLLSWTHTTVTVMMTKGECE